MLQRNRRPGLVAALIVVMVTGAGVDAAAARTLTVKVRTAIGRQRVTVGGRVLAKSIPQRPFTLRMTDAPKRLATALGPPRTCRRISASLAGHAAARASYRTRGGARVTAELTAVDPGPPPAAGVCDPGSAARLRSLEVAGAARVVTDIGKLRSGMALSRIPPIMRDSSTRPFVAVPAQDPCSLTPAPNGADSASALVDVDGLRDVRAVIIRPADEEQCLTAQPRDQFAAAAISDPCSLISEPGEYIGEGGCHGNSDASVVVSRVPDNAADQVPNPEVQGRSVDGTVLWTMNAQGAILEGRGLRVDLTPATSFSDENSFLLIDVANRLASGIGYGTQPDGNRVSFSAALRVARPDLGDVVVGEPSNGADTIIASVYRDGLRVGFATFLFNTDAFRTSRFSYDFAEFAPSYGDLCGPKKFGNRC